MPTGVSLVYGAELPTGAAQNQSFKLEVGQSLLLQPVALGAAVASPLGPATLTGQIYIDPANVSGVASDSNPPTIVPGGGWTIAGPVFRTYAGVVAAWGTQQPLLAASTTLAFLSTHPDATDPVVWEPYCRSGAVPSIVGIGVAGAANALTAFAAKNRTAGANAAILATYGGPAPVVGNQVFNSTHSSVAWQSGAVAGQAARTSQPMTPITAVTGAITPQGPAPGEVDTWANADSIQVVTLVGVNLVLFAPVLLDFPGAPPPNWGQVMNISIIDPLGAGVDYVLLSNVVLSQCRIGRRPMNWGNSPSSQVGGGVAVNGASVCLSNCFVSAPLDFTGATLKISGGSIAGVGSQASNTVVTIDGDTIIENGVTLTLCASLLGFVCLAASLTTMGGNQSAVTGAYGGHVVYAATVAGAGILALQQNVRLNYAGTATASLTYPGAITGVSMNSSATATSHTSASPDVLNQVATTVANIDAAAGAAGFGGVAFKFGGCVVTNLS